MPILKNLVKRLDRWRASASSRVRVCRFVAPNDAAFAVSASSGGWSHVAWPRVLCLTDSGGRLPKAVLTRFGRYARIRSFHRACDLYAALQLCQHEGSTVAAIVIDLTLPDFDFLAFLASLRRDRLAPNADVIHVGHGDRLATFSAATGGIDQRVDGRAAGFDARLRAAIERCFSTCPAS